MPENRISASQTILHDQKLAAWAFAVGERPGKAESCSCLRPHRGMLPDVDFDRPIADPGRRSLLSRLADFLSGGRRPSAAPADAPAEPTTAVLGERLADAYIGQDQTGKDTSGGAAIRPSGTTGKDWSRAA